MFENHTVFAISITVKYALWNKASKKVLINNGFTFVKYLEKGFKKNGQWMEGNLF